MFYEKKIEKEFDNLETAGIITKSPSSDWVSPLVVIPKADNTFRLCVDCKTRVNNLLINTNFPIRKIDGVLNSL